MVTLGARMTGQLTKYLYDNKRAELDPQHPCENLDKGLAR